MLGANVNHRLIEEVGKTVEIDPFDLSSINAKLP